MEIKSLADTATDTILDAFEAAFADYAVKFDRTQLRAMLQRRGFCKELSFAAFDNGRITAFTLNGIGEYNGILSAYDTGTGTLPDYRGQGLARAIFRHSLPYLRQHGIHRYLLEVMQENAAAIAVYRSMGFSETADYNCFTSPIGDVLLSDPNHLPQNLTIEPVSPDEVRQMQSYCDFLPSWQNSIESIIRGADSLLLTGAFTGGRAIGYCVADPASGDITQIAVHPGFRRQKIATALLRHMLPRIDAPAVKCLNIPKSCHTLPRFLESANIHAGIAQYAMSVDI